MKAVLRLVAMLSFGVLASGAAMAQPGKSGVQKLYVLNCGEGVAGDVSLWSPGINEGKSMDFVDNCYLIEHAQGWFLWDTGIPDAVALMPNGLAPANPKATHWRRPKTLAAQLEAGRYQGNGCFPHPPRSYWQCRTVPEHHALCAEGRI